MGGEYTVAAIAAPLAVVALELWVLRTGLLRSARYWLTMAIAFAFQVPVDGWLTRPDATVVHYDDAAISGLRVPWHIPVEDYGFGFALMTLTLLLWLKLRPARAAERGADD
ncbi:lycopene cyclase domain-containing protein [Catellatospora sp. KI3]|uniref:lycopene cyclase domain-containing protein n=1 Tax=Catellatospora sp. KI3 TaxID=3041620 RepID=UPI0024829BD7|nr:lycopene cyclase domain-containing protein [Catellatospora sp. KI3]MDI1462962.1 lycopene cyclase domain-containing protein [Catellatospora sp. KI3]